MKRFFSKITTVTAVYAIGAVLGVLSSGGCQHKMSAEQEKSAADEFKGVGRPANEAEIMAKEKATAEAYRKAHPEQFPTNIKR